MKKHLRSVGLASVAFFVASCGSTQLGMVSGEQIMKDVRSGLGNEVNLQEPVVSALTLEESIARALKYNLKQRLGSLNEALSQNKYKVAQAAMLPSVVASMDYKNRNKYDVSDSRSLDTNLVAPGTTISRSRDSVGTGLAASWNILDFGLSYVRSKQAADRVMIAAERRRKVTHELVNEVQSSYWRAHAAQELEGRVKQAQVRVSETKRNLEAVLANKLDAPIDVLRDLREILSLELQLKNISRELVENKTRLASLMGMLPNARYALAPSDSQLAKIVVDYKQLENYALQNRTELREDEYNIRISRNEVTAAMLGMLPGVNLSVGLNGTNDDLVANQSWVDSSLSIGWNLMNLVTGVRQADLAKVQLDVAKARKLVVGSAVLMSVRLSWLDYWESLKNYRAVAELQDVEDQLIEKIRAQARSNNISPVDEIRADISNLVNVLRHSFAFADVKNAQNRLLLSIAYDPSSAIDEDADLEEVTAEVKAVMGDWQNRVNNLGKAMATETTVYKAVAPTLS